MGTITTRKRKDGTVAYKAQIRVRRSQKIVYGETETFDRKEAAKAWVKKRETELAEPGAIERIAAGPEPTLKDAIDRFLKEVEDVGDIGDTMGRVLKRIAGLPVGATHASKVDSTVLVDYARDRIMNDGVLPQTVNGDFMNLNAVFKVAAPAWKIPLDPQAMEQAKDVCRRLGLIAQSGERSRVPTIDEMNLIMGKFWDISRRRAWAMPMLKIAAFAIFSTRRQEEITLLRWDDLDETAKTVIVRDLKHPRKKIGNHQVANLTDEALAIIKSMPRISERIFPFTTDSIKQSFIRATEWMEIEDLRFHDLRRAGVTRLFEMGWNIPNVAAVSLHRDWNMLRRYTNLQFQGDRYAGWPWLQKAIDLEWTGPKKQKKSPADRGQLLRRGVNEADEAIIA